MKLQLGLLGTTLLVGSINALAAGPALTSGVAATVTCGSNTYVVHDDDPKVGGYIKVNGDTYVLTVDERGAANVGGIEAYQAYSDYPLICTITSYR